MFFSKTVIIGCQRLTYPAKLPEYKRMEVDMIQYSDQKKPAFFRIMSPELFFEAEAMDTKNVLDALSNSVDLDAELEALLNESEGPAVPQATK